MKEVAKCLNIGMQWTCVEHVLTRDVHEAGTDFWAIGSAVAGWLCLFTLHLSQLQATARDGLSQHAMHVLHLGFPCYLGEYVNCGWCANVSSVHAHVPAI